jgi:predicted nucleic acid-binding protein
MLTSGEIVICVDARILLECDSVLRRPTFAMDPQKITVVLEYIQNSSELYPCAPLERPPPDADDAPFLEVAVSSHAACLITGNAKHFPASCRAGVPVLSPTEFLDEFKRRRSR